jgi:hypothetical protein
MKKQQDQNQAPADTKLTVNTSRLEALAVVAANASQAKQWHARKNGLLDPGDASEVRSLTDDAEARAQAEAAMQRMMAKPRGNRRGR